MQELSKITLLLLASLLNSMSTDAIERLFKANTTYMPQKTTSCRVKLSDGKYIDLSSLDQASNPRVTSYNEWYFKFNPCKKLSCKPVK